METPLQDPLGKVNPRGIFLGLKTPLRDAEYDDIVADVTTQHVFYADGSSEESESVQSCNLCSLINKLSNSFL